MNESNTDARPHINCLACGYSLRGLPIDGNCPECGTAVATSIGSAFLFRRREIVVLTCRLLAIWLIVVIAATLADTLGTIASILTASSWQGPDVWPWIAGRGVVIAIYVGTAAVLWRGAGWFGRRIFATDGPVGLGPNVSHGTLRSDLEAVALAAVGIYLFVDGMAFLTAVVLGDAAYVTASGTINSGVVDPVIRAIVGALLLIRAGTIGRFFTWLRTAGTAEPRHSPHPASQASNSDTSNSGSAE